MAIKYCFVPVPKNIKVLFENGSIKMIPYNKDYGSLFYNCAQSVCFSIVDPIPKSKYAA